MILRSNPIHPDTRVDKIARTLARAGYHVQVLGWDYTGSLPVEEQVAEYMLTRLHLPVRFGRGLANFSLQMRWQLALLRWLSAQRHRFDILHACDLDTLLPALYCKAFYKKRLVYDIFDFYADMLRSTPAPLVKMLRKLELWGIGKADAVILADDSRREQIAGSRPKRLEVIYNTLDESQYALPDPPPVRQEILTLAYIGLLQRERGLFELLELLGRHPEWSLELGGSGGEADELQRLASSLSNVRWHGRVPHETAMALNAAADLLLATFDPAIPNHRYSSSNKLFEAMLLGKPILVAQDTNMDRLVEAYSCGAVIAYGQPASLEAALLRFQTDPHYRQSCGENARRAYETRFNWPEMERRLLALYREVSA